MKIFNKGEEVKGKLGKLCFGGTITERIESKDWVTKEAKYIYTVKLPCHIFIQTEEIFENF